ncbi:MAG: Na+/H+ antiporter subunit E [Thermodesulfobacteriota bacterium]
MFGTATFILLFALWLLLSGKFDLFHLSLGALSCALVARLSSDLLFLERDKGFSRRIIEAGRFLGYFGWLLWQIVIANFHVIGLALSGRRMRNELAPHIFSFKTILRNDFSRFVLANSITLTPGTVTIRIHGDTLYVHAISQEAAGELADQEAISEMERRVAMVFERNNFCYLTDKES